MKIRVRSLMVVVLAVAPAGAAAQGQGRPGQQRPPAEQRRSALADQVHERFMGQVASRLGLTEEQRGKLDNVLAKGMEARRELAAESQALRMELMRAVRSDSAGEATYRGILDRVRAVRARERSIEDRESRELGSFLDARQQAMFLVMRMQFNDRIQRMRGGPAAGRGGGGPGNMRF